MTPSTAFSDGHNFPLGDCEGPRSSVDPREIGDPLLTAEQVADRIHMGVDWVYSETRAGRTPHVKLGRYRRYRASSIERWIVGLETCENG